MKNSQTTCALPLNLEALDGALESSPDKDRKNDELIEQCFCNFPLNKKTEDITAKVLLIDLIYSTNLRFCFNDDFSLSDLVDGIRNITQLDEWLEQGDEQAIEYMLKISTKRNLFSFVTKYCCAHNYYVYKGDAFSIYDSTVKELLPQYAACTGAQIESWRTKSDYHAFNQCISNYLSKTGIETEYVKFKFDRFLWNQKKRKES